MVIKQKTLNVCEVEYKNEVVVKMKCRVKGELLKTGEPERSLNSNGEDNRKRASEDTKKREEVFSGTREASDECCRI